MPRGGHRRGIALILTTLVLMVMVLMMGLSIDWGKVTFNLHELQNATDAAALAAAQWVKIDQIATRDWGQALGQFNDTEKVPVQIARNEGNDPTGEMVIGRFDKLTRTFTPTLLNPNAVKVVGHRTGAAHGPIATIFGSMAGVDTVDITREAIARSTGATGAGLICLNLEEPKSLLIGGNVILDVEGGDIMVNSNADNAAVINGGASFTDCDMLKTCGDIVVNGGGVEELPMFIENYEDGVEPIPDPLENLEEPDYSTWADLSGGSTVTVSNGETRTFSPGRYDGGFEMTGGDVTFEPGIYIFNGTESNGGFQMNGGNFTGNGIMIFVASGPLDLVGNGTVTISAPDPDSYSYPAGEQTTMADYYEDVSIFQSRSNRLDARITGTSGWDVGGILYFPKNHVDISGTAGSTFRPGDQLICDTANLQGTCTLEINYTGQNVIEGFRSVLVK